MRRGAWVLPAAALVAWLGAVGWPLLAAAAAAGGSGPAAPEHRLLSLALTTSGWALAVAIVSAAIGWLPGRLLGQALGRRGYPVLAALYLIPICLPAYIVFYAWWQTWPGDSFLHAWAARNGFVHHLRLATLFAGLATWSWPLAAWCVAAGVPGTPAERDEAMQVDGAGRLVRMLATLRADTPGLAIGAVLVFFIVFNNTTCFDLAQVWTFGNELRVLAAHGATPAAQVVSALPGLSVAIAGGVVVWVLLGRRPVVAAVRRTRIARPTILVAVAIWLISVLGPLGLFGHRAATPEQLASFWRLYGGGLMNTIALATVTGLVGAMIAVGMSTLWQDHRRVVRWSAHFVALGWLVAALAPGHAVAAALEAAYNIPADSGKTGGIGVPALGMATPGSDSYVARAIYRTPIILVLGHLARFGFVSVLLGRWLALQEPKQLNEMRRIDAAETLTGLWISTWPRLAAAAVASFAVVLVLSVGEVVLTARLQPPGFDAVAGSVLNAVHYQRPEIVVAALAAFVLIAVVAAALVAGVWAAWRRVAGPVAAGLLVTVTFLAGGCAHETAGTSEALNPQFVFGRTGIAAGRFDYPRCLAVDRERELVYVIDKTARVQQFNGDGEHLRGWIMPEYQLGKPTGISVGPDGTVYVADTHYYRIIAYDPDGREKLRLGGYGEEPGRFIYTTDVAIGPDDLLYVSEYGGNDRIQVFTPDGEYLFGFGGFGPEEGQFNRPQSMLFDETRTRLYVADACNHRIVVLDPEGRVLSMFGREGRAPGQLLYPYDLTLLDDGSLLVAEFGNNRIQHLAADGRSLGVYGSVGTAEGQLKYPWGVDVTDDHAYVLDSGNNRVQVINLP